jgi:hypothetical protein
MDEKKLWEAALTGLSVIARMPYIPSVLWERVDDIFLGMWSPFSHRIIHDVSPSTHMAIGEDGEGT